jgi:phosphoglycolate phosphatase
MIVKAIIFDLDGTLLDTGKGIVKCVASTLSKMGLAVPNEETCKTFVGPPLKKRFLELFKVDEKVADDFVRLFREEYAKGDIFLADRYPGMGECLAELHEQFPLAVATNKREDLAIKLLEKFEMAPFFDAICGSDAVSTMTKEQIGANAAKRLGVAPAECLMVGDSSNDAEAAERLGMPFVGVTYGYGFRSEDDLAGLSRVGCVERAMKIPTFIDRY